MGLPAIPKEALLNVLLGVANGIISIQQVPQFPEFQGSVMLNVAGIPQDILDFIWFRGPEAKDENRILTYTPKARVPQSNGVKYHGRITAYPNGSLRISNLDIPDKGSYAVQIRTNTTLDVNFVNLKVYKPVGKTTVKTTILPVENEIFSLTCTSANAETIKWTRDNAILPPGAVLASDKRTVTFSSISREDSGIYQCTGENPISKMTSEPYILTVFCK
ncbi:carcinoembryonic antigen-related cell adhesion molecule 7-like [Hyperolius riggenbachi]|uniref:carcinoembryonic antigen-related cell adhesion molecule 7-like n=1 Tax=Hyperolius riggenbachi TaxID=752182 RepID=UPI0035A38D66